MRPAADDVVLSNDGEQTKRYASCFDFIPDTGSAPHELNGHLPMLKREGTVLVGLPEVPPTAQGMLDFCAEHDSVSEIETTRIQHVDEVYERMFRSDVDYRFVMDMASLRESV